MSVEAEEAQTIEFYQSKLMEKQRQISNFDNKLKKSQLKLNIEIKEAKMGQDRAKNLLKQQKAKIDKLTKQAKQNQQQNILLNKRLVQLKEDKDKQIAQVRSQYNKIKEEVRTYERILPTHTFLSQSGLKIQELPTYQDIFLNLKEKVGLHDQLTNKFEEFKAKTAETIKIFQQNEELLKNKKIQAEKNLKEVLPKLLEYQHQITDLKLTNEQYQSVLSDLKQQIQAQQSKNVNLQQMLKQYQLKVQQINQQHNNYLHQRQIELKSQYDEQFERYEQEIKSIMTRLQIKENLYAQQLGVLEEQINNLHARLQQQKEKGEEMYLESREELEESKNQIQKGKREYIELKEQFEEVKNNLVKVAIENQKMIEKIKNIQIEIKQSNSQSNEKNMQNQQKLSNIIQQLKSNNDNLQNKYNNLTQQYTELLQEKSQLVEQINLIRSQIMATSGERRNGNSLDIPSNVLEFEQKFRKASTQIDQGLNSIQQSQIIRDRKKTFEAIKHIQQVDLERRTLKDKVLDLQKTCASLKEENSQNQKIIQKIKQQLQSQTDILKNQLKQLAAQKNKLVQQVQSSNKQKTKLLQQSIVLKQKIVGLNKKIYDLENVIASHTTKQNLSKNKTDSLEQQLKIIKQESRKDKETIKGLKQQLKTTKQSNTNQAQKLNKQLKQAHQQKEASLAQSQRLKVQFTTKQKKYQSEIAHLNNLKQLQQKLKDQVSNLQKQLNQSIQNGLEHQKRIADLLKEIQFKSKQIQKLQEENITKDRQNQLIAQSLTRQRKQRTLRSVPSLQSLQSDDGEQQNFNGIYMTVTQKQGEINILQRQVSDLLEEIESLKINHAHKLQALQLQQNDYIDTIIQMKMKCAESEMRASEKEYLYTQLKRKMGLNK